MDYESYYTDIRLVRQEIASLKQLVRDLQCDLDKERMKRVGLEILVGDLQQAIAEMSQ